MNYILENSLLRVEISSFGAEIQSVKSKKTGIEYLWQGNEKYWKNRATVLFPICGRLCNGKYTYKGETYEMVIHGFAKKSEFSVIQNLSDKLILELKDNETTKKQYPFSFVLRMIYTLQNNSLKQTFEVFNPSNEELLFSVGGHPGFNVPFKSGEKFEDYYLEFDSDNEKLNSYFSDNGLTLPFKRPYPMENGKIIKLKRSLFDDDAIFLDDCNDAVTLKNNVNPYSIRVEFNDMTKIGFWQTEKCDAPFLCIEPWHGIPANEGEVDDFSKKNHIIKLNGKQTYSTYFKIIIQE